jgi:hypothetical protein
MFGSYCRALQIVGLRLRNLSKKKTVESKRSTYVWNYQVYFIFHYQYFFFEWTLPVLLQRPVLLLQRAEKLKFIFSGPNLTWALHRTQTISPARLGQVLGKKNNK